MKLSHRIRTAFTLSFVLLGAALFASPAEAQRRCDTKIRKPYICNIDLVTSVRGESQRAHVRDGNVAVPGRGVTILSIRPEDQFGEGFPARDFSYDLRVGNACRGLVDVQEERVGELRLTPSGRSGNCELVIAPAGQPSLDMRLNLVVSGGGGTVTGGPITGGSTGGYPTASGESAVIARWLYRAILGREGEPSGIDSAAAEIARGRTEQVVDRMLASPEFSQSRSGLSAAQVLDRIYQGLLARPADPDGQRHYSKDMLKGEIDEVIEDIMKSDEFKNRLRGAAIRR